MSGDGDAVAHGVDPRVAGAQGLQVHGNAVLPVQTGALRQPTRSLQTGRRDHLVGTAFLFSGASWRAMATESSGLSYTSPAQAVTRVIGGVGCYAHGVLSRG